MIIPTENHFPSSHGNICYFEWGERGAGQSILLLHATGFHARCWDKVIAAFPKDSHVIAVDQLGHGRSDSSIIKHWDDLASATAELVHSLDITFDIGVGHSMGGHCLVQVAAKLTEAIKRLVLVDPVIMEPEVYHMPPSFGETSVAVAKRRNQWSSVDEMFERFRDRHPYRLWDQSVLRDYCEYGLLANGHDEFLLACPAETEGSVYATSTTVDPYPHIEKITQPVKILRAPRLEKEGKFDFASSPTSPELAGYFANGVDVFVEDLTHFMPMQEPERIARLIMDEQG